MKRNNFADEKNNKKRKKESTGVSSLSLFLCSLPDFPSLEEVFLFLAVGWRCRDNAQKKSERRKKKAPTRGRVTTREREEGPRRWRTTTTTERDSGTNESFFSLFGIDRLFSKEIRELKKRRRQREVKGVLERKRKKFSRDNIHQLGCTYT